MNNLKLFVLLIFSMIGNFAKAEVWHSTNTWDRQWEKEYESWVSANLKTNMFTRDEGILSGIATDCADALYDVRIQFAYEHSLPFIINAPDVLRSQMKTFGSDTSKFDSIKDERKRVRAFINFVNDEVGTENLVKDTYPVKISEINGGIIYHVVWSLFGKEEHHSYIVKGFDADRELLYYASDAPRKVRSLQIDTPFPRFSYASAPYGFRRWKHPEHLLIKENEISPDDGYSVEQYKLVERVGKKEILKAIRRQLQK
jgi:hypothetical protein